MFELFFILTFLYQISIDTLLTFLTREITIYVDFFSLVEKECKHHIDGFLCSEFLLSMEWREHVLHFFWELLLCVVAIVVSRGFFALILRIVNLVSWYIHDAKKWRDWQFWDSRIRETEKKEREEMEKKIEELEHEKEWANDIINDYIGYTDIFPREISEKLEKRNKRKKRK